jgi:hypothetical protein
VYEQKTTTIKNVLLVKVPMTQTSNPMSCSACPQMADRGVFSIVGWGGVRLLYGFLYIIELVLVLSIAEILVAGG